MKKICFVVAAPVTANAFLRDHISALSQEFEVYLVGNIKNDREVDNLILTGYKSIEINRGISISKDLKAAYLLYKYFKQSRFHAIHSVTPKAGLVTALAGFFARVHNRIHIFTGQVWATRKGPMRWMLMLIDRLIVILDNHILVDGESQRQFLINHKIISAEKSQVLGAGSICGVDAERYTPCKAIRHEMRKKLNINYEKVVFVFLGRLNRDKGLHELLNAFNRLAKDDKNAYLLIFGTDEENISSTFVCYENIKNEENFKYYGHTSKPEKALQAGDVFCLPTYREGFGSSVIEASCLGLSVICSDVYGVRDTMVDDETGLRCKVQDVDSLYSAMKRLSENSSIRATLGNNGRKRVLSLFLGTTITKEWVKYYNDLK